MSIYGRAAPIYLDHGWLGVLPLPPRAKAHPPTGYTGANGVDPTRAQIDAWCADQPDGNICLRLPDGVIGIDIDAYGDKHGDASLLALEAELGLLPATWRSTSRTGRSGIYLFQVPVGRYQDKPAPSIEIIQHHHRYVVVMPSVHPEGRAYAWIDDQGSEQRRPPRPTEIAWLPDAWLDQLRERPHVDDTPPPRRVHEVDGWTPAVTRAFTKALLDMPGGRHDAALHAALTLVRLWSLEHPGAADALDALGHRFRAAIADRASPAQADREWSDMVNGARIHVRDTPATAPKWEAWPTVDPGDVDAWLRSHDSPPVDEGDPALPAFGGLVDWPTFWAHEHAEQEWLIEPVLARGRAHALYAPAKAGKSLLALEVAAAAATGRPVLNQPAATPVVVLYLDFEMTEDDLHERLTDLGYGPDDDLSRFHYHLLPSLPALDTQAGGQLVAAEAVRIAAVLVVIDTVARVISGEESSADTFIALARHTMVPLKRHGMTVLRIDHAGKNLERGQRNSSAKNDDVDIVWQLTVVDDGVTLRATHRRLAWVPEVVNLTRTADPLTHRAADRVWPDGTQEKADRLDALGAPYAITHEAARVLLGCRKQDAGRAVQYRLYRQMVAGTVAGTVPADPSGTNPGNRADPNPSDLPEPSREPSGTDPPGIWEPGGTYVIGAPVPADPGTIDTEGQTDE